MEDIKVGEYIRTVNGYIIKYRDNVNTNIFEYDGDLYIENSLFPDEEKITKHSPNIIDLIEEGDYVNGDRVKNINGNLYAENWGSLEERDIKNIVTKEMFNSIKYEV